MELEPVVLIGTHSDWESLLLNTKIYPLHSISSVICPLARHEDNILRRVCVCVCVCMGLAL